MREFESTVCNTNFGLGSLWILPYSLNCYSQFISADKPLEILQCYMAALGNSLVACCQLVAVSKHSIKISIIRYYMVYMVLYFITYGIIYSIVAALASSMSGVFLRVPVLIVFYCLWGIVLRYCNVFLCYFCFTSSVLRYMQKEPMK